MISDDRGQNITPYLSLHLIAFIRYVYIKTAYTYESP